MVTSVPIGQSNPVPVVCQRSDALFGPASQRAVAEVSARFLVPIAFQRALASPSPSDVRSARHARDSRGSGPHLPVNAGHVVMAVGEVVSVTQDARDPLAKSAFQMGTVASPDAGRLGIGFARTAVRRAQLRSHRASGGGSHLFS